MNDERIGIIDRLVKADLPIAKRNSSGKWAVRKKIILRERYGDECCYCGGQMVFDQERGERSPLGVTVEHIIPLSLGGENLDYNLRLAHFHCNQWAADQIEKIRKGLPDAN